MLPVSGSGSGLSGLRRINVKKLVFAFSLLSVSLFAGEWSGTISDSKCAAKHEDASPASMKCAQACVGKGADPVLVSEGKVYKIADKSKVTEHVGHKVTVTGDLEGDTITVDTVKMSD